MKCSSCKAARKGLKLHRWDMQLCADGRRRRVFHLCNECDVSLNYRMLLVMGDTNAERKIAKYKAMFE